MQGIREPILHAARHALPVFGIGEPVRTVRREGPGADMGDARRQRIDIAVGAIRQRDLVGEPIGLDRAVALQEAVHRHHELGMVRRRDLAVVGKLADVPQPFDVGARPDHGAHVVVARSMIEHENVFSDRRTRQRVFRRRRGKRGLQGTDRGEVEIAVAPLHQLHRLERVRFQRLDQFGLKRRASPAGAERAVAGGAAGAAGNLGKLGRIELAELIAVEFAIGGKRDVIDVEIEPHADGVGGDQIIDLARLIELDLGIARARRQCAEHDGGAATLAADQFRDGVNFVGRECDDGGAARQPRQLFLAGKGELRQARPADDAGAGQ